MQEQNNFKYIYRGEEISQEEFNNLTNSSFKWFNGSSIRADDLDSVFNFFGAEKSFKGVLSDLGKEVSSEGVKTNNLKPQMSLLFKQFPKALEAIVLCSQYGHEKYKETDKDYLNYTRVDGGSKTYADAGLRHRLGQGDDLESGLPHQYHVAWNAIAELQLWIQENE